MSFGPWVYARTSWKTPGWISVGTVTCDASYEDGGRRAAYLEHQPHHEDHGHAGDDVCMILDDKFMAQDRRVLRLLSLDHHPGPLALWQRFFGQLSVRWSSRVSGSQL